MSRAPAEEYIHRIARLRALMAEACIDATIISDPLSYEYFSAHRAPQHAGRPSILIVPADGQCCLITMGAQQFFAELDGVSLATWVEDLRFYTEFPFSEEDSTDWGIRGFLLDRGLSQGRIGVELGPWTRLGIPQADYARLVHDLPNAAFVDAGKLIWACRGIKSDWEVRKIREACAVLGDGWDEVIKSMQVGVTQSEIRTRIGDAYRSRGSVSGFLGFARGATGTNGAFTTGDVLYLDGGGILDGYATDFTRRVVFGDPSKRQRLEHEAGLEAQKAMLDMVRPGVPVTEVFAAGNASLVRLGFGDQSYSINPARRTGHGIGIEQGEPPSINGFDRTVLEAGMVLTIEPKFMSADGLVNPDDMVLVTQDGYELLSLTPDRGLHVA